MNGLNEIKESSIWDKIKSLFEVLMLFSIIIMISLASLYLYQSLFWKPYDDASNHLLTKDEYWKSITYEGNNVTITFDSNISYVSGVAMTGSQLPLIGGRDVIICLNSTPQLGEIVSTDNILHMVYSIEDGFVTTRGINNEFTDKFKFPRDKIDCVVGAIIR